VIDKLAKAIFTLMFLVLAVRAGAAEALPPGPVQAQVVKFQFAVYYSAAPSSDPLAALASITQRSWPALAIVKQLPQDPEGMLLQPRMEMNVAAKYAPPDATALGYFGRGLSKAQVEAVQGSKQALQLNFSHPARHAMEGLRTASNVAEQVARSTGGLLWDEETREMFTPDKWRELRLANWHGGVPDVSRHITIHSYKNGELVRAITLGMTKFGLPDLVINQFPWSSSNPMGSVINLVSQSLAEGAQIGAGGQFNLDINTIANKTMRERELATLKPNGHSVAKLALFKAAAEDGDPANRLAEISFSRYSGPDPQARQNAMLSAMFGYTDNVKKIRHNAELVAASQAAQMKLAGLRAAFARGLRPGEYILLKAPFAKPSGGSEWMWVEVSKWQGEKIEGLLKNEPYEVPTLHAGQTVQVSQGKVFDYIRRYPDGKEEGNRTSKIIEKMNNASGD
jgi:hypothetical protein